MCIYNVSMYILGATEGSEVSFPNEPLGRAVPTSIDPALGPGEPSTSLAHAGECPVTQNHTTRTIPRATSRAFPSTLCTCHISETSPIIWTQWQKERCVLISGVKMYAFGERVRCSIVGSTVCEGCSTKNKHYSYHLCLCDQ